MKEYRKLSAEQFRAFIDRVPEFRMAQQDLQAHLSSLPRARLEEVLTPGYNWGTVYELSFLDHLAVAVVALNLTGLVQEVAKSPDPQQRLIEVADTDPVEGIHPQFEMKDVIGLVMSLGKTLGSLLTHGRSLSSFVHSVRESDDLDALFEVVRIDRAAVACPSIADRIARAEILGDEAFFLRLRNALKGPSKKHWGGQYEKMRYAMAILRELGIDDLSVEQLEVLVVQKLDAYPDVPSAAKNLSIHYRKSRKIKTI